MLDPGTITLIVAIIGCILSIASFVRSGSKGAEAQGRMMEKLDQVYNSVERLTIQSAELTRISSQSEEKFNTLFSRMKSIEERVIAVERKQSNA